MAEQEKALLLQEQRQQQKRKKKKKAKLDGVSNHFELKVLAPNKKSAAKKSAAADDFMKVGGIECAPIHAMYLV